MPDGLSPLMYWPLLMLGAYLLGSIPFSQVAAKINGVDLRTVGSGNVGAGNLKREVGLWWAVGFGLLDGLKGTAPVLIAKSMGLGPGAAGLAGIAAVVGHNWSIFMKGRSGRGLATSAGILLGLDPILLVWTAGWSIAGWKIGGGLAGFLGWGLLPIVAVALNHPPTESLMLALIAVIVIGRRMQGNLDSPKGTQHALRRAMYDTDSEGLAETADDPLTQ